jgi:hypothetical protein
VGVALGSWVPLMKMGEKRRKTKRKCKNSLQFMDLMCIARKCISSNLAVVFMYFRCTKQKECRLLRWGYKVCISQQESRQMFLVSLCLCFCFCFFFFFFTNSKISSQFCFYISSSFSIEELGSCKV